MLIKVKKDISGQKVHISI